MEDKAVQALDLAGHREQPGTSSRIVLFYRDGAKDTFKRKLTDMHEYGDLAMERSHDHMQWMFPLHEPSMYASESEVLSDADVLELQASELARDNMRVSISRFRAFLGLGEPQDQQKSSGWAYNGNHNCLRVTRAIRSLRLFGLEDDARHFYEVAMEVAQLRKLSRVTQKFWTTAMDGPVMGPLQGGRTAGVSLAALFGGSLRGLQG